MVQAILIVDDDAQIRQLCRVALEKSGYVASEASDGKEALAAIRKESFDLIVLQKLEPMKVPAILTSGNLSPGLKAAAQRIGAEAVHKAEGPDRLLRLARRILKSA